MSKTSPTSETASINTGNVVDKINHRTNTSEVKCVCMMHSTGVSDV